MTLPTHRAGRTQTNVKSFYEGWLQPVSGSAILQESREIITSFTDDSFVGINTPNYRQRLNRGELIPMTYWYQRNVFGSSQGSYNLKYTNSSRYYSVGDASLYEDWWSFAERDAAEYAIGLDNRYVQAAAAKIYSKGHDTATFIAELESVKSTFIQTARRIANFLLNFKKASRSYSKKDAVNDWLSARYGWRPLLGDIDNLSKVIAEYNNRKSRKRYRDRAGITTNDSVVKVDFINHAGIYVVRKTTTNTVMVKHGGTVVVDFKLPQFQFNLLQTGWELIPYSFVVDWVVNVGRAISALTLVTLSQKLTAAMGYQIHLVQDIDYSIDHFLVGNLTGYRNQKASVDVTLTGRFPCKVPLIPQIDLNIDCLKVVDLIGLIFQRM